MAYIKDSRVAIYTAEWTTFIGVSVLQVPGSRFVAVPQTGKKNAAKYDVIDTTNRVEFYAVDLAKKAVGGYLASLAGMDEVEPESWMALGCR